MKRNIFLLIYFLLEYMKNILYFQYILYLVDIVILSIYALIVIKYWNCNRIMGI
jgi:hypothetical protein